MIREALERTEYIEADLEAVLAGSIAGDARVKPRVGQSGRVDDQRADSFLVDDDLVQEVRKNLASVAEPQHVRDGSARHHAVEAGQVALGYFEVGWDLAKYRLEKLLRHASQISFSESAWAVEHTQIHNS